MIIDLKDKNIKIIGAGKVALRKTMNIIKFGAKITIIAPNINSKFYELEKEFKNLRIIQDNYKQIYLKEAFLVIAATSDRKVNEDIYNYCQGNSLLCNIVDSIEESSFIVPSVVKRGDLIIGISTSGKSPNLASKIKKELDLKYGIEYIEYTKVLGEIRRIIIKTYKDDLKKRKLLKNLTQMNLDELKDILSFLKNK